MEHSKSWLNSPEVSKDRRDREDRLLSDLTAHDGWLVFERMVSEVKDTMMQDILTEASSEWDAVKKERLIKTIDTLDRLFSMVKQRAGRYRRENSVIR